MAKYEYEIKKQGPKKSVVVYEDGVVIFTGKPSFSVSEQVLIDEAKIGLRDSYPGVDGMVLKGTTPSPPVVVTPEPSVGTPPPPPPPVEAPVVETPPPVIQPEPEYKFTPPENTQPPKKETPKSDGYSKGRIYNVFKPTIVLDELSLRSYNPNGKTQKIEDKTSLEFPFIKINDYIVSRNEIDYFSIDSTKRLPSIILTLSFINDKFLTKELPKDGDIISVAITTKTDLLVPIRNDYIITGLSPMKKSTTVDEGITMTFFGELFVPGLSGFRGASAFKMTSMDALKAIARELKLGFNTNEENTDDKQLWFVSTSFDLTIEEIASRSWKDENSFFDWWIDIYYNFNFINVQKQLLSSEDDIDIAASLGNIPKEFYWGKNENTTIETPKVFSNFLGYRTTSFYITDWKPINKSSAITYDYGASVQATFFEHNKIVYTDTEKTKYWSFKIEPAYDPQKIDSHILLRGRPKYDPSINTGESARANYNFVELYSVSPWLGIQYTISNPEEDNSKWTGNHHKNYCRSLIQNILNRVELEKLNVEVSVQGVNLNVIKGDKLPVVLIQKNRFENLLVDKNFNAADAVEFFYSGWYYVKGFTLSWIRSEPQVFSQFSQTFILTRREWPTPIPVDPLSK